MLDRYDILGSIILIDDIIFCNKNGTKQVDHATKGRPCIIVAELEQYYFCPLTSSVTLERLRYYQDRYYMIEKKDTLVEPYYETHRLKPSYINLQNIISMELYHLNKYGEVKPEIYYKILTDILEMDYQHFDTDNIYKIEDNLNYQKKKIEEKYHVLKKVS